MFKVTTYYTPDETAIQQYKTATTKIWSNHMFYTRNAIISVLNGLGDSLEVTNKLMKNQEDIGDLLRPYYDSAIVDMLIDLLKSHITIAVDIITAAKAGAPTNELVAAWQENGKQIVEFFEDMNSYWEKSTLESLWNNHMDLTVKEVQYRIDKNWSSDIMNFDKIIDNAILLADCISQGVIYQNKIKFCTLSNGESHELTV